LETLFGKTADELRGAMNADDLRDLLSFLFLRYLALERKLGV